MYSIKSLLHPTSILNIAFFFILFTANTFANTVDKNWLGSWQGMAHTETEQTPISLEIRQQNEVLHASISLKEVGVTSWPASRVELVNTELFIELPTDSGVEKMHLNLSDKSLVGSWKDAIHGQEANVKLQKSTSDAVEIERRVIIKGPAGNIGASVFLPDQSGSFPAIVFVHGSGPQIRDVNRYAAMEFSKLGIASIIFDKRGVGETEGKFSGTTFEELADDAIAVANFILAQERISFVGFVGHSQGGWIATLAAANWNNSAFVITSAGPAVTPAREAQWWYVYNLQQKNADDSAIEMSRKVIEYWHDGIRSGDWLQFNRHFDIAKQQAWFAVSDLVSFAEQPDAEFANYYKAFMDYQPLPAISSLDIPYLAMLSPDDESIDATETMEILRSLDKPNFVIKVYPGYAHNMRKLGTNGGRLRWPTYPEHYFQDQARFILQAAGSNPTTNADLLTAALVKNRLKFCLAY
jgi:pimeloyl-ACP methyl ester carboxylesterase